MLYNLNTMKKEIKIEVVWPIRMTQEFKDRFKIHCDEHGYSMNKKIKILMEEEMNKNIK
jgi:hypothetical protein